MNYYWEINDILCLTSDEPFALIEACNIDIIKLNDAQVGNPATKHERMGISEECFGIFLV